MSSVLSKMKVRTPNCSAFPFDFRNKMSNRIGELRPVAFIEMGPNDRCKMSMAQLTRFFPLSAPAMANFQLQVDSVFVPARIVAKKYEKFFNAGTVDTDRPRFPSLTYHQYTDVLINHVGLFTPGLLDYLGYPTFENAKDFVRNMITSMTYAITDPYDSSSLLDVRYFLPELAVSVSGNVVFGAGYRLFGSDEITENIGFDEQGFHTLHNMTETQLESSLFYWNDANINRSILDLVGYVVCVSQGISPTYSGFSASLFRSFCIKYGIRTASGYETGYSDSYGTQSDVIQQYLLAENKHLPDLLDDYFNYVISTLYSSSNYRFLSGVLDSIPSYNLFEQILYYNDDSNMTESLKLREKNISLLPLFSFWKAYFDWYVNSVLEHGEDLTDEWSELVNAMINDSDGYGTVFDYLNFPFVALNTGYPSLASFWGPQVIIDYICRIPSRLWAVDRFTGAYTDTQNGQAVLIPTDGTIRDLKASNQLQRYLEKALFGGTRTIDKNELIFGAHSSNQLLDRTEVLSRKKFNIDIQQVTNSAASAEFDLGTLAGNGFGMGSSFLFDYTCEERGYIMIFASVVLPPSYVQALDRNLLHTDYYDFVIPEFDSVGEQEINPEELYFDKGMLFNSVGYNRRYYEAIDFLSSVHGDFKNTLRHWHDARFFKQCPQLSSEFIRIDPENDDLERIFATYNHDQILHFFAFSGAIVRPMSKYMQFGAL